MASSQDPESHVAIIGGGPAGLTAGYLLAKEGWTVSIFENDLQQLGGLSRTINYKGFRMDLGGHCLESKSAAVMDFWTDFLGKDLIERPRLSRVSYRGRIFSHPQSALEMFTKLGFPEAFYCGLSYLQAQLRPTLPPVTLDEWGRRKFGDRLFEMVFQNYTRKLWDGATPDTPGASYHYPRLGPGMLWDRCGEEIRSRGGTIFLGHSVTSIEQSLDKCWTVTAHNARNRETKFRAAHVISTTDLHGLIHMLQPTVSSHAALSASSLQYRDFLSVSLIVRDFRNLPDQTIDLYDPQIKASRLQNYKAWSPDMVPDASYACYGLEYAHPTRDGLWKMSDNELIQLASRELEATGIARVSEVEDGHVIRQSKACPVYDKTSPGPIDAIRKEIAARYPGLHLAGRNGMHKAHNLDHAIMTGMLTARNILAGENRYDVWDVNPGAEYLPAPRSRAAAAQPMVVVPTPGSTPAASASGLRLVPRNRTGEQLAALNRQLSIFRGPSPNKVGTFQVHAGGGARNKPENGETPPPSAA